MEGLSRNRGIPDRSTDQYVFITDYCGSGGYAAKVLDRARAVPAMGANLAYNFIKISYHPKLLIWSRNWRWSAFSKCHGRDELFLFSMWSGFQISPGGKIAGNGVMEPLLPNKRWSWNNQKLKGLEIRDWNAGKRRYSHGKTKLFFKALGERSGKRYPEATEAFYSLFIRSKKGKPSPLFYQQA